MTPRGSGEEECPGGYEGEIGGEKATGGGRPFPGDEPRFGTGNSGSEGERDRPRRLVWAILLKRSLDLDVLVCPRRERLNSLNDTRGFPGTNGWREPGRGQGPYNRTSEMSAGPDQYPHLYR